MAAAAEPQHCRFVAATVLARQIGVSLQTLARWCKQHGVATSKPGGPAGRVLVDAGALQAVLAASAERPETQVEG